MALSTKYSKFLSKKLIILFSTVFLSTVVFQAMPFFTAIFAAAPVISNVTASNITSIGATVSWTTSIAADTQIEYGTTTSYGSSTTLNSSLITSHSQNLSGLTANQLYHYRVKSKDALGDLSMSGDRTLITALGAATSGTTNDSNDSNTINTTKFTTVYGGKVASLSVFVGAVDPSVSNRNFQLALYSANGNVPGTLITNTANGTLVANSWNTLPVTATLSANTGYFIAYNTNGASSAVNNMRYITGGTSGWKTGGQTFGAWPATFGAFSTQNATFSLYATFVSDSTPPTIAITDPVEGATVNGSVNVAANASDDTAVSGVQFKLDGNNLGPVDTTAPYAVSFDTASRVNGPAILTAVATDVAGNSATAPAVNVSVVNPAKVTITQPTAGQSLSTTTLNTTYTKGGDWVAGDGKHVHFRLDGGPTKMDFDTDQDQTYTFLDVPGGAHTIEAVVADSSHVEQVGSGATVSFTTNAPDTTPPVVAITSPAASATVQNTVNVTADASDEIAVVGVQFLLDGNPLGAEDTTAPYSASWNTTSAANGNHTITARARDSVNQTTSAPTAVTVQNTDPRAVVGEWGSVMNWPLVSVHATLLHTGEILMWDAWETPISNAKLWNPTTNTFTEVPVNAGLFCAGQATAPDGQVVTMGGHAGGEIGIKNVTMFNPITKAWTRKVDMQQARWYPSVTEMPDGRMITFSGQITSGNFANTPEIFNPKTNTISSLPFTTPQLHEVQYPQTSVLPSGKILSISAEQGSVMVYSPSNNAWTNTGTTQVPYGAWTSFAPGKYLITGGGASFNSYDPSNPGPSQKGTRILDMTTDSPVWSSGGDMNAGRSFHNVTMLPTGKALAIGGSPTVNDFSNTGTLTADQWDPATNTWTQMANPAKPRMYHSVSILLPDGRVLSAGGGRLSPAPDQLNAQFYSPPYLFQGPRPTIASAPVTMGYNTSIDITSPEAADISKVTLVNLASVTHTADWNQHFMELNFTKNGNNLAISTPANANLAPENYYMVFLIDSKGVPSMAKIIKLGAPDTTPPVVTGTQAAAISGSGATISWNTDEIADTQVEYGTTTAYGSSTTLNAAFITAHSQNLSGLSPNTTYNYRVKSRDTSGNIMVSGNNTFTTSPVDSQAPTASITAPSEGSTVSGSLDVTASAADNIGVAGVQFKVNGTNLGSEDTTSPYSATWVTNTFTNGAHSLTAVARDAAGNATTSAAASVTVSNTAATGGLVGAYSFNEGLGSVLGDISGAGNNGSIVGATWLAAGKFGKALSFNGTSNYVSVPDAASLDFTNRMTLEAWVRPTASSGWRTVMLKESGSNMAYTMYARENSNRPSGWTDGNISAGATPGLPLNAWTHMATTYDGSNLRLYINGVLRATRASTTNIPVTTGPLKFGGNAIWGEYFAGQLDEIRLYNRALTQTEIQTDMNQAL